MNTPFAGRKIGKYTIKQQIGGGMSLVFKATDSENGRDVALKLVHLASADGRELAESERRGAKLQQELFSQHAPVPEVYPDGEADGYYYLPMEFIEGEDLSAKIERSGLNAQQATKIAVD